MINHILIATLCGLTLLSCGMGSGSDMTSNSAAEKVDRVNEINIVDSLKLDPALGKLIEHKFQSTVPAASCSGIEYTLLLYNQKFSGDGVYKLTARYIEAEKGKDLVDVSYGKQYTLRGDATNIDAVVYQLIPFVSDDLINLLLLNDGNLEMLNREFERAPSKLNYTLKLQSSKADHTFM